MQRATASEVSKVKPIGAVSWNSCRPSSAAPGGAVGCTSTGSPRRSISFQILANIGSVSVLPPMLASTTAPTAPASQARFNSWRANASCCQGSDANQRMRDGQLFCARAMSSFMMRAALVDRLQPAAHFLQPVARPAVLLEEREPLLRQHVRVDVDDWVHEWVRAIFLKQMLPRSCPFCYWKIALTPFYAGRGVDCQAAICQPFGPLIQTFV